MRDFIRAIKLASLEKKWTYTALFLGLFLTLVDLSFPFLIKIFFDNIELALKSGQTSYYAARTWPVLVVYTGLLVFQTVAYQVDMFIVNNWWARTERRVGEIVFAHMETLSLSYFEKHSTGKIKERTDRGVKDLVVIVDRLLLDVMPQVLYIVIAIVILLNTQVVFGLILLACVPFYIFVSMYFSPRVLKFQDKMRDVQENISGIMTESILNMRTIKSYTTEKKHYTRLSQKLLKGVALLSGYSYERGKMNVIRIFSTDIAQVLILGLGVYWTINGEITLGTLTLAWQYANRSIQPLWWITRVVDDAQRDMRSVKRMFELLDTEPEIKDEPNATRLKIKKGLIRFEDLEFSYDERKVVSGINLTIQPGKTIAFVGKSGVGKTTLIKLLMRFYDPERGRITIDDQDIKSVTQKSLRENIGYVLQDSALFNDTAQRNIAYGSKATKKSEIIRAAKVAHAHEFIKDLPKGYNTIVGERGVKLSGGEQQRINIARAVLKNPPILVLDEATSSLDSESEQKIQDALWKLIEGRTTLIVAHRLSTVMRADLIVVMDKGKIQETGTHEDLVKKKGIYAKLFEIQSGGYLK